MTAKEWINKNIGQHLDFDSYWGAQCKDVINFYSRDVVGIKFNAGNAIDAWNAYPTGSYTKIANTPSFVPKCGDIMVWGTKVGQYGHIAVCTGEGDVNYFVSADQNWPFDDGKGVLHYVRHNYSGVLGVLRPNKDVNFDQAAWDAEQARIKQAEADRLAEAEAKRVAEEQARLAAEQEQLKADLAAKAEEERLAAERLKELQEKAKNDPIVVEEIKIDSEAPTEVTEPTKEVIKEDIMSPKFSLNMQDVKSTAITLLQVAGSAIVAYLLEKVAGLNLGEYTLVIVPVLTTLLKLVQKYIRG
jgi:hypothetical protein